MPGDLSHRLYQQAQKLIPGGVNSPVRSFRGVGGEPLFIMRGRGSRVWDADGNEYVDYLGSWGPLILGHAHPSVVMAVREVAAKGTSFGAPIPGEVELARLINGAFPSMELVRLVNSGTEAAMSAIRAARAFTGRDKVIKFAGAYHGHADGLLVQAGSGGATLSVPDSAGVPAAYAAETLVARYNDVASVQALFDAFPRRSPPSSLSPWRATWASCRQGKASSRGCGRSPGRIAPCSSLTRSSPASAWPTAARRPSTASRRT